MVDLSSLQHHMVQTYSNCMKYDIMHCLTDMAINTGKFFVLQLFLVSLPESSQKPQAVPKSGKKKKTGGDADHETAWKHLKSTIHALMPGGIEYGKATWPPPAASASGEENPRILVAADFCHHVQLSSAGTSCFDHRGNGIAGDAVSSSEASKTMPEVVHVATRFTNAYYKKWQPGFLLAFLAQNWLSSYNIKYWDLGGYSLSPMMSYKHVVATVVCQRLPRQGKLFSPVFSVSTLFDFITVFSTITMAPDRQKQWGIIACDLSLSWFLSDTNAAPNVAQQVASTA